MNIDKLKDIKNIEILNLPILDITLFILSFIFVVSFIVYLIIKFKKVDYKFDREKEIILVSKDKLKEITFNDDVKKDIYTFSVFGKYIFKDKNLEKYNDFNKSLNEYKYSKKIKDLDENLKKDILKFIKKEV